MGKMREKIPVHAYLSIGSNHADAALKLRQACEALAALPGIGIRAISPLFKTEPQDFKEQNWFYNQCLKIEADGAWEAEKFLASLLLIETSLGRERDGSRRFGPRAIDLDLLLFGQRQSSSPFCQLPHPRMQRRAFVLLPLFIIEPTLTLYGRSLPYWLSRLEWKVSGNKIWQT